MLSRKREWLRLRAKSCASSVSLLDHAGKRDAVLSLWGDGVYGEPRNELLAVLLLDSNTRREIQCRGYSIEGLSAGYRNGKPLF